jgi:hypothetical protein
MSSEAKVVAPAKGLSVFEKYLYVWVILCILAGIVLGKVAPGAARFLDGLSIYVGGAPVVSIPIAVCLFFMMYPIMVKIDFAEVLKAGKSVKPVGLTLFVNWAIKPFTMYAIALLFLGVLFRGFIGAKAMDYVKMPFGLDLSVGDTYGVGTVMMHDGVKMLEVPLWRSYLAGCILLGEDTPAAVSDYAAGPSHILPTTRTARFSSGLGVYDFLTRASVVRTTRAWLADYADTIHELAALEGFDAHSRSVRARLEET